MLTGGTETTRNAIAGGIHALLSHPDQYAALKDDTAGLVDNAVEEILLQFFPDPWALHAKARWLWLAGFAGWAGWVGWLAGWQGWMAGLA